MEKGLFGGSGVRVAAKAAAQTAGRARAASSRFDRDESPGHQQMPRTPSF